MMQLIRTNGPEVVRLGPITSTIGAVLEVEDDLGTSLLAKTSVTFERVGAAVAAAPHEAK